MASSLTLDAIPPMTPAAPSHRNKGVLLIVDDEDGARQALRVIFKEEYHVLTATDGASAIRLVQDNKVNVAVLDVRMAGMSGIEALERLKFVDPDIEVVI